MVADLHGHRPSQSLGIPLNVYVITKQEKLDQMSGNFVARI